MMHNLFLIFLGWVLWAVGSGMTGWVEAQSLPAGEVRMLDKEIRSGVPVRVTVPQRNISAAVIRGGKVGDKWILAENQALYTYEGGQLVIYAHNSRMLFGELGQVKLGEIVLLIDKNSKMSEYKVYEKELVRPNEVGKLQTGKNDTVVLVSCGGVWESKRWIVKAQAV